MTKRISSHWRRAGDELTDVLRKNLDRASHGKQPKWRWLPSALTSVIDSHWRLDPTWPHLERWIDGIEFSSIEVSEARVVKVAGTLWWGELADIGGAQTPEAITAEIALTEPGLRCVHGIRPEDGVRSELWAIHRGGLLISDSGCA